MDDMGHRVFDRTAEDVGNIVEFGHVNCFVPDQRLATLFYVSALGLTRDPFLNTGVDNMWVNVGTAQFHLPHGAAQVLRGTTHLVVPDLDALRARLDRTRAPLAGTRFDFRDQGDAVLAICPWGNRILCHAPGPRWPGVALGMVEVELAAPSGTAPRIAEFYREVLRAPATSAPATSAPGKSAPGKSAPGTARVAIGAGFTLTFRETSDTQPDWDGHHIQISLADFSSPYAWLAQRGLITEESDQHQYRFQDVIDINTGDLLVTVEHEVRSMRHPLYARSLLNRNPAQGTRNYVAGAELLSWARA